MHSDDKIAEMKLEKTWNKRFSPYLRKVVHDANVIKTKLSEFKIKYKATASSGKASAQGRLDPQSQKSLFTPLTHDAIVNCIEKAEYITDIFCIDENTELSGHQKPEK